MIFPVLEIGDFYGINTDLRIDANSIPYPEDYKIVWNRWHAIQVTVTGTMVSVMVTNVEKHWTKVRRLQTFESIPDERMLIVEDLLYQFDIFTEYAQEYNHSGLLDLIISFRIFPQPVFTFLCLLGNNLLCYGPGVVLLPHGSRCNRLIPRQTSLFSDPII